jgi:hypothetical protein
VVHQVGQAESANHEAEDSSPVLPGGRNFGLKAQKGQGKNKVSRKNLWPNFTKSGRKGAGEYFLKKFLI